MKFVIKDFKTTPILGGVVYIGQISEGSVSTACQKCKG